MGQHTAEVLGTVNNEQARLPLPFNVAGTLAAFERGDMDSPLAPLAMTLGAGVDAMVGGATKLAERSKYWTGELIDAAKRDVADRDSIAGKAYAIGCLALPAALVAVNLSQVRKVASAYAMVKTGEHYPVLAPAVGTGIHATWYLIYAHALGFGARRLPNTVHTVSRLLRIDKLPLSGLEPNSTVPPENITGFWPRFKDCFKKRSKRAGDMAAFGGTTVYIVAAAKQPDKAQRRLANTITFDGTLTSLGYAGLIAGITGTVAIADPEAAKSMYNAMEGPVGVAVYMLGAAAVVGGIHAAPKLRERRRRRKNEAETQGTIESALHAASNTLLPEEPLAIATEQAVG